MKPKNYTLTKIRSGEYRAVSIHTGESAELSKVGKEWMFLPLGKGGVGVRYFPYLKDAKNHADTHFAPKRT